MRQTYKEVDEAWRAEAAPRFFDGEVDTGMAGSCSVTVLMRDEELFVANCGDSRAVLVYTLPPAQHTIHLRSSG